MMNPSSLTIFRAESFVSRLLGLLARAPLGSNEALYLAPCASVHTMFMGYAIDVVFLDGSGRVVKMVAPLGPWRATSCWGACAALELRAGEARRLGFDVGSFLDIEAPLRG